MPIYNESETKAKLIQSLDNCDRFIIAVAWITQNDVFNAVKRNIEKAEAIIAGIDFYQTDPKILEWLNINAPKETYIANKSNGVFHPKMYAFWTSEGKGYAMIGSANLTYSAFSDNDECCVSINLNEYNENKLYDLLKSWKKKSTTIQKFDINEYKELAHTKGREIRFFSQKKAAATAFSIHPELLSYSFEEYFEICKFDNYQSIDDRLELIKFAKNYGNNQSEFCFIGGIDSSLSYPGNYPKYGYFGTMNMDKTFYNELRDPKTWQRIHKIYQSIPTSGNISKNKFIDFVEDLTYTLNSSVNHVYIFNNHLACATRLLAMRRPDFFYCQNNKNRKYLGKDLKAISKNKLNPNQMNSPEGYWSAVEMIQNSSWGNSTLNPKWSPKMQECWHARIAMIDSLYYEH